MNPRGFGFVIPHNTTAFPQDIFIAKHATKGAMDEDIVVVNILPHQKKDKGPEGLISQIVERKRSRLGGIVLEIKKGIVWIYTPSLGKERFIQAKVSKKHSVQIGSRVIVHILEWNDVEETWQARIEHVLGSIEDPSIDIIAASEEFQIEQTFPSEAIQEAKLFGSSVTKKDKQGRIDLSKTTCITIDPTTAKDFDDALSLSKDSEGHYHLGVHIADVSHYVQEGSALDLAAKKRANSTYFPGTCIPMLPEELSNHLCSLKPLVARLCISVFMVFDKTGILLSQEIQRSWIRSAKRFTYEEAKEILDKKKKSSLRPLLLLMVELATLLKQQRSLRGCIDFVMPDVVLDLDNRGMPFSFHVVEYDITHQLVEEFMLKANEVVAQTIDLRGIPLLFRIHERPGDDNQKTFLTFARALGFAISADPTPDDLQKLFAQAEKTPHLQQLSIAFIRSMKLASYSPDNVGHYGLSLEHYCHFTSPIRRYPDLLIHRLLFSPPPPLEDLQQLAEHCSIQERASFKAEQSVKLLKKLRLLQLWQKEDPEALYPCVITKIRPFSLFFEFTPLSIEGSLHISEIGGDYFIHDAAKNCFLGRHTHTRLALGDIIQLQMIEVDLIAQEVSWQRIEKRRRL